MPDSPWLPSPGMRRVSPVRTVHLVRHAMPELTPALGPEEWPLSAEGRRAARALQTRLPHRCHRVASRERKAQQTLELALPGEFEIDGRLDEVRRPLEAYGSNVRPHRQAWVTGTLDARHEGWETPAAAAYRFDCAIRHAPQGEVVVATHGMVMTAWLISIGVLESGRAAAQFWDHLAFPDVVTVPLPIP